MCFITYGMSYFNDIYLLEVNKMMVYFTIDGILLNLMK